jgi:hypothetical protein
MGRHWRSPGFESNGKARGGWRGRANGTKRVPYIVPRLCGVGVLVFLREIEGRDDRFDGRAEHLFDIILPVLTRDFAFDMAGEGIMYLFEQAGSPSHS